MKKSAAKTKLYWFNWPSHVGGADTKFVHLLPLLSPEYDITVVPNDPKFLQSVEWLTYLDRLGVKVSLLSDLPGPLSGWAVALCNGPFLKKGIASEMKSRGARIAWSNEMMWHFEGEIEAIQTGLIDRLMYVSPKQRAALEPGYIAGHNEGVCGVESAVESGLLPRRAAPPLPWVMTGNWIEPAGFPFRQRGEETNRPFTVGRLSRPDPDKFPDHFPRSYETLSVREPVRFRVMGWSEKLSERWCEHQFDNRWELLPPASELVTTFLDSLDVFVYDLSPRFRESWGRAVVEAMLCGVVPIVPRGGGHHLENLVTHGLSGFLCDSPLEFGHYARMLRDDFELLRRMSVGARQDACTRLCCAADHLRLWRQVFL
jgi:glycosyltransferase involved in cell wall biosynthesis